MNKCATLRHAGRYGGGLIDRGSIPVLKKASPPSISAVSKDFNICEPENSLKNDKNVNVNTICGGSNNSLSGVGRALKSEYDSGNFSTLHKRSASKKDIKCHDYVDKNRSENPKMQQKTQTEEKRQLLMHLTESAKENVLKDVAESQDSILNQSPPIVLQKDTKLNNYRSNQQLLSASKLENFRERNTVDRSYSILNKSDSNRYANPVFSTSTQCVKYSPLDDRPPSLPPKNRNRKQFDSSYKPNNLSQEQQIQFNVKCHSNRKPNYSSVEYNECIDSQGPMILKKKRLSGRSFGSQKPTDICSDQKSFHSISRQQIHQNMPHMSKEQVEYEIFGLSDFNKEQQRKISSGNRKHANNLNFTTLDSKWKVDEKRHSSRVSHKLPNKFFEPEDSTEYKGMLTVLNGSNKCSQQDIPTYPDPDQSRKYNFHPNESLGSMK